MRNVIVVIDWFENQKDVYDFLEKHRDKIIKVMSVEYMKQYEVKR